MSIITATAPRFGDIAIIDASVWFDIEYDDNGHIIGSQEWYDAKILWLEEIQESTRALIDREEQDHESITAKHEAAMARELEPVERRLDSLRKGLANTTRKLDDASDKILDAPTEARLLDIWPDPPYGAPLLLSLVDEPLDLTPPYGETLVENLL